MKLAVFLVFPLLSFCATRNVCNSGCTYSDPQAAFDAASPGDTIVLQSGETYGSLVIPFRANGITVKTSLIDRYPRGYRIARNAPELATISNVVMGSYPIIAVPAPTSSIVTAATLNARTLDGLPHGLSVGDAATVMGAQYGAYNCASKDQPPYDPAHNSTACSDGHWPRINIRAHTGISNGQLIHFRSLNAPPPIVADAPYYVINFAAGADGQDSFQVSTSPSGPRVVIPAFDPAGTGFNVQVEPAPFAYKQRVYVVAVPTPTQVVISDKPGGDPIALSVGGVSLVREAPFHDITFDGVNISSTAGHLVEMIGGASDAGEPYGLRFLRCWFHGSNNHWDTPRMGIQIYARNVEIGYSVFSNIESVNNDTQGAHSESTGNIWIHDCDFEDASEAIMAGGDYPWFALDHNPKGFLIQRNFVHKRWTNVLGLGMTYVSPTQFQFSARNINAGMSCDQANTNANLAAHCFAYEENDSDPMAPVITRTEWSKPLVASTFSVSAPLAVSSCPIAPAYGLAGTWGCGFVYLLGGTIHMDHNFSGTVVCPQGVVCAHEDIPLFPDNSTRIGVAIPGSANGFDGATFWAAVRPPVIKNGDESKGGDHWDLEGNVFRGGYNCDGGHACQGVQIQFTVATNGSGPAEPSNYLISTSDSIVRNNIFEGGASVVGGVGKSFGYSVANGPLFEFYGFGKNVNNRITNNLMFGFGGSEKSITAADGPILAGIVNVKGLTAAHNTAVDMSGGFTFQGGADVDIHSNILIPPMAHCAAEDGCTRPAPTSLPGVLYPPQTGVVYYPSFGGLGWVPALSQGITGNFSNNLLMNRMGNYVASGIPDHYPPSTYLVRYTDTMGTGACVQWGDPGCPDPAKLFAHWVERNPTSQPDGVNYRKSNYRLASGMAALYPAKDARAIGADIDEIEAVTGKGGIDVVLGRPQFSDRVARQIAPSTNGATISYLPNGSTCTVQIWNNSDYAGDPVVTTSDVGAAVSQGRTIVTISGLTGGGAAYFGKRWCGDEVDVFNFTTPTSVTVTKVSDLLTRIQQLQATQVQEAKAIQDLIANQKATTAAIQALRQQVEATKTAAPLAK